MEWGWIVAGWLYLIGCFIMWVDSVYEHETFLHRAFVVTGWPFLPVIIIIEHILYRMR